MSAILILSSFCAAGANAHEYWLTPSAFSAEQASVVAIHAFVGTGFDGELLPYAHQRTLRFVARADRDIDLAAHPVNGSVDFAYLKVPDDRGVLVAYGSTFTEIELPARKFEAYLAMEGLDGPRKERAARGEADLPGRERFARCPKTWIAAPKPDLGRLEKPVGLPLEIVALADPQSESTVPVRVLYHGDPLPDALVRAWNQSATAAPRDSVGPSFEGRTDARGVVDVPVGKKGEWLLSTVHMTRSAEPNVDWESLWASLTFARGIEG